MTRQYYSQRKRKHRGEATISLDIAKDLFLAVYKQFVETNRFQEFYGYDCVDAGWVAGRAGSDVELFFLRRLRKRHLWPIESFLPDYTEDDLFDVIELLYDTVSEGVEEAGFFHNYNGCGWHYREFTEQPAKEEFRSAINEFLQDYGKGFELSEDGEILELPDPNLGRLLAAPLPATAKGFSDEVQEASLILRRRHSTIAERRNAVRMLVDILESLRPRLKAAITKKDENDLFEIANRFGIRHKNDIQKTDYDPLWLSWMFYYYLSTIHFVTRKLEKTEKQTTSFPKHTHSLS
jgi:hypothetical protein